MSNQQKTEEVTRFVLVAGSDPDAPAYFRYMKSADRYGADPRAVWTDGYHFAAKTWARKESADAYLAQHREHGLGGAEVRAVDVDRGGVIVAARLRVLGWIASNLPPAETDQEHRDV